PCSSTGASGTVVRSTGTRRVRTDPGGRRSWPPTEHVISTPTGCFVSSAGESSGSGSTRSLTKRRPRSDVSSPARRPSPGEARHYPLYVGRIALHLHLGQRDPVVEHADPGGGVAGHGSGRCRRRVAGCGQLARRVRPGGG